MLPHIPYILIIILMKSLLFQTDTILTTVGIMDPYRCNIGYGLYYIILYYIILYYIILYYIILFYIILYYIILYYIIFSSF